MLGFVTESNYPEAKAGDGQIFFFPGQSYRYVRVYATKLNGVGAESGYRLQLTDLQVFQ
ncbi:hypothetical protein [Cohnella silvisoli]|uniref:Uncharacterized protein n=1 Tax=Cohnella silvisoli TaxID=2873699 RepID=A0ABV1L227_9BACL|nr:hypothetical protein [Cohnella silvisoli]MCD9025714.1 hypothetical protein [Cohnella silvisoli]